MLFSGRTTTVCGCPLPQLGCVHFGLTQRQIEEWLGTSADGGQAHLLRFGIAVDDLLVGYVDLAHLTNVSAEFGIAIGDSKRWGEGIGTAAARLLLHHAFGHELGLLRVDAVVPDTNLRALQLMKRFGFQRTPSVCGPERFRGELAPMLTFELHRQDWREINRPPGVL